MIQRTTETKETRKTHFQGLQWTTIWITIIISAICRPDLLSSGETKLPVFQNHDTSFLIEGTIQKNFKINKFRFYIQYLRVRNFQTRQVRIMFTYSNSGSLNSIFERLKHWHIFEHTNLFFLQLERKKSRFVFLHCSS